MPNINHSKASVRKAAERTAINAPMQGSAADIIKIAMINVHDFLIKNKLKSKLIMQVHDELVIETENQEVDLVKNEIKKIMESVLNLKIPLKVDVGTGKIGMRRIRNILSIAGVDSSGGAGIYGDLKTISSLGCYGAAITTALTAQNTRTVKSVFM